MRRIAILLTLVALLLLAGVVLALAPPPAPRIDWWVISPGGGHAEAGIYTLEATIGQPMAGTATRGDFELCAGFRCDVAMLRQTFLPLILRLD